MRAVLFATAVAVTVAVPVVALAVMARSRSLRAKTMKVGRVLILVAAATAFLVGAGLLMPAIEDSGPGFAVAVTTGPLVVTLLPAAALRLSRLAGLTATWVATLVMLAFVVLFGLGIGWFYLPTALLLLAAAVVLSSSAPSTADSGAPV